MALSSPEDVLDSIGQLWAYGTRQWLTYRCPSEHSQASRWPVAPEWTQIQDAAFARGCLPLDRIQAGAVRGGLRLIMPGLNGYVASFAALIRRDDDRRGMRSAASASRTV